MEKIKEAINVTKENDRGGFKITTKQLYTHPWKSGRDNYPNWDKLLNNINVLQNLKSILEKIQVK